MIRALIFLALTSVAMAVQEPRFVAEEALAAWHAADAKRLDAIAHPEFKKRCRDGRLTNFYVEDKESKKQKLISGSDSDVIALFCEALRAIIPRDDRIEYFDRYVETVRKGDLAIVVFDSGWKRKSDPSVTRSSKAEIVLQKSGDDWLFLWSIAAQVHIDLGWDPRD
jgi:hypothetical protein